MCCKKFYIIIICYVNASLLVVIGSYINVTTGKLDIFSTPLNNVYKCSDKTSVNAQNVVITIDKVSLIAFNKAKNITSKSGKTNVNFIGSIIEIHH